jgi:hypothetical protein
MAQLSLPFSDPLPDGLVYLTIAEAADRTRCCESPAREACDHRAGVGPARRPWIGATAQVVIATTRNGFAAGRHLYLRRCRSGDLNATRACGRRLGWKSGRLSISQRS